jgi:hypothetical protein
MVKPPFKLATSPLSPVRPPADAGHGPGCCGGAESGTLAPGGRTRLAQLPGFMHCSVIGTCIGTAELRKIVARHIDIERDRAGDLEVHNAAVSMVMQGGPGAKALHKALDHRHEAAVRKFAQAHEARALAELWREALASGEIPGAYWALVTHRDVSDELRKTAFGDVHMLSHLVGAANRADIRRLVALEEENADLQERLERQQSRVQELVGERDQAVRQLRDEAAAAASRAENHTPSNADEAVVAELRAALAAESRQVAVQTARREKAEHSASAAEAEIKRLQGLLEDSRNDNESQRRELAAVELRLEQEALDADEQPARLDALLKGRRILYVGGRARSMPTIRNLVTRHGGELMHHDGGLEERKGLLASALAGADVAMFPVDCIDHDSAGNLKRLCLRNGIPFMPLRSSSVASFVAGLAGEPIAEASKP